MIKDINTSKCNRVLMVAVALFMLLPACGHAGSAGTGPQTEARDTATYTLPMPEVPKSMTSPEERAAFIADRYWDRMDWQDTALLNSERFMGESMATYGTLLAIAPRQKAASAVNALVNRLASEPKAMKIVADYAYNYFYYPDAPQHDAEIYLMFVNPLLAQRSLPEQDRQRLLHRKEQIHKNRVGEKASDFEYVGTDGRNHRLLSTAPTAGYRVLMLYDPECDICDEAVKIMSGAKAFTEAQRSGEVQVIAINAYGQEEGGAAKPKKGMPAEWIVGYSKDGEVDADEIYAIRATPAIYVLDREGRVLEKDLSLRKLREFVEP